jgi:hypothetical protein
MTRLTEHPLSLAGRHSILAWASVAAFALALTWAALPAGAQSTDISTWPSNIDGVTHMGPYVWLDYPSEISRSGVKNLNEPRLYVCRGKLPDGVHPGKYFDNRCYIGWGDKEVVLTQGYQILLNMQYDHSLIESPRWVPPQPGEGFWGGVTVQVGWEGYVGSTRMRVCMAKYTDGFHLGKEWDGKCHIGWGGKEVAVSDYTILRLSFNKVAWNNLVAYWNAGGAGDCYDRKGRNHGSPQGGVSFPVEWKSVVFSFNGTNGYVKVPANQSLPHGNSQRTFMMWVYTRPSSWVRDRHTVFHFGGNGTSPNFQTGSTFGLDMDNYPNMDFYTWGNDIKFDAGVPQEGWVHVAVTYDGGTVRVYTNGQQRAEKPMALNTALTNLEIGAFVGSPAFGGFYFDGLIDEFMVFNRALEGSEIKRIYEGWSPFL